LSSRQLSAADVDEIGLRGFTIELRDEEPEDGCEVTGSGDGERRKKGGVMPESTMPDEGVVGDCLD